MQENCAKQAGIIAGANYGQGLRLKDNVIHDPTVGENIDAKIANLRQEIERLEESKKTLEPLLGMRISDLRNAMAY